MKTRTTHSTKNVLHFTTKHSGKMAGLESISTSPIHNEFCQKRHNNTNILNGASMICRDCFSIRQAIFYSGKQDVRNSSYIKPFIKNDEILNGSILDTELLPLVHPKAVAFRLQALSDMRTENEFINYLNFCQKQLDNNDLRPVTIWTKNIWLIAKVFEKGYKKPENLTIIYSSPFANNVIRLNRGKYWFVDMIFTCYSSEYMEKNNVVVNCGARSCKGCMRCYPDAEERQKRREENKVIYVNEKIK